MVAVQFLYAKSEADETVFIPGARAYTLLKYALGVIRTRELGNGNSLGPFRGEETSDTDVVRYGELLRIAIEQNDGGILDEVFRRAVEIDEAQQQDNREFVRAAREILGEEVGQRVSSLLGSGKRNEWDRHINFLADAADFLEASGGLARCYPADPPAVFGPPPSHHRTHGTKPRVIPGLTKEEAEVASNHGVLDSRP